MSDFIEFSLYKGKVKKVCECGESFMVYPYRAQSAKYCSGACQRRLRKFARGYKSPRGSIAKMGVGNPNFGKVKEDVGYRALHLYVEKRMPKKEACEKCGERSRWIDLANKSGRYLRELSDWWWLCRKCHVRYDDNLKNLKLRWANKKEVCLK